ncbi:MAG: hypothetical protein LBP87_13635 [Planctomycetaceae bacterium]|jgi:hypothetical protein|nr:hypothetical protein [Planctomycetaceae bacterium]
MKLKKVFNFVWGIVLLVFTFCETTLPICGQTVSGQTSTTVNILEVPQKLEVSQKNEGQMVAGKAPTQPAINPVLTALEHPWGRFSPQSWVCLQRITWTNREGYRTADVREIKTTLQSIDPDGVTLQDVLTTSIGGKQAENAPIIRRFDFFQQPIQEGVQVRNAAPTKLIINHLVVPCEVRIYEQTTPAGKRKTTIWYSTQVYPYVLRSENVLRSIPTDKEPEERILDMTITEVLESSAFHLRKSKLGTYRLRTTQKSGNVTTITEISCSRHVPGGVLQKTTREFEKKGNMIREIRTVETRLINVYYAGVSSNNRQFPATPATPATIVPDPSFFYLESIRPRWRYYYAPYYYAPYPLYWDNISEPDNVNSVPKK